MTLRTTGTNLTADIESAVTSPRLLVKIVAGATSLFYSTAEDIAYSGDTYTKQDMHINGLTLAHGGSSNVTVEVKNNAAFLAVALGEDILDAALTIYQTAKIGSPGSDDVVAVYDGTVDHPVIVPGRVSLMCTPPVIFSPSVFINAAGGFNTLDGPGTYSTPNGIIILTRDDG